MQFSGRGACPPRTPSISGVSAPLFPIAFGLVSPIPFISPFFGPRFAPIGRKILEFYSPFLSFWGSALAFREISGRRLAFSRRSRPVFPGPLRPGHFGAFIRPGGHKHSCILLPSSGPAYISCLFRDGPPSHPPPARSSHITARHVVWRLLVWCPETSVPF